MTKALTRLAVENREILEHLDTHGAPPSVEAFARLFDRDPSNFRKTLRSLEAEGWISLERTNGELAVELTADGAQGLAGMRLAEGRLRAGLPTLTHAQIIPDPNQPAGSSSPRICRSWRIAWPSAASCSRSWSAWSRPIRR